MSFPNRELSQFASFLSINDVNRNISITTNSTPFIGIGTTVADEKLHVIGNVKISGIVTAKEYYGDGSTLGGVVGVIDGYFISTPTGIYTGANVGIGTSVFADKLNIGGSVGITSNLTAYVINSSAPTGIAPFSVQSSTLIPNLNADLFRGRTPPNGNFVGDNDTQTITNKTLTSPIISTILNGTASLIVPTTSGTLIHSNAVGIITSGVYGDDSILNVHVSPSAGIAYSKLNLANSIVNSDINVGAGISYSKLNLLNSIKSSDIDPNNKIENDRIQNSTISGVSLGSNLNTLTRGSYLTGNNYNGSSATTWAVDASTANVASTVVARDSSGIVNATGYVGNGITPIGGIIMWSGTIAEAVALEPGWALCDGRVRNGRQTPNLTNRFIVAASTGAGIGTIPTNGPGFNATTGGLSASYTPGNIGGGSGIVLGIAQMPSHNHDANGDGISGSTTTSGGHSHSYNQSSGNTGEGTGDTGGSFTGTPVSGDGAHSHPIVVEFQGGNAAHENRPDYYALAFIMRTA